VIPVSTHRVGERRETLRRKLPDGTVEAVLVSLPANVSYLSGFSGDSSVLVVCRDRDLIVSDGRFAAQLAQECPGLEAYIRPMGRDLNAAVVHVIQSMGLKRVAVESSGWTVGDLEVLVAGTKGTEFIGVQGWVEALRRVKDAEEVAAIRQAVRWAERAFVMARAGLRADDTEKDVADAVETYLRRCGASAASFPTIVAVGVRSALPHARPTTTARIGDDDFTLIDWGASGNPYKSDLTRVIVTGNVTPTFEMIYGTVLTAQERAISMIRPGVRAHDVDAAARSVIESAGYGGFFDHGLGHGLGMDVHEAPRLRPESQDTLEPGMVVTIEPGIYLPEWGGIRIEDDVLVTPDGCEVLSHIPKTLDSVRVD
jgi:Xaa-Pro aminopeptidase